MSTRQASPPRPEVRRGFALPAAVLVLSLIGLFLAATAFSALQESRSALGAMAQRVALEAAEHGATAVLRDWNPAWNTGVAVGASVGPLTHTLADGATAEARLTRLTPTYWWVVSQGSAGGVLARRAARRTVNVVIRLDVPADSALALGVVSDSARMARLSFAAPIRVRDRWWSEF